MIYNNTILVGYIGDETEIVIPEGVTEINQHIFNGNDKITSVTLPSTLTTIGSYAFLGCKNLTTIYINSLTAVAGAVTSYSSSKIFDKTKEVFIQKDVDVSAYKFTKVGKITHTINGVNYQKYTDSY